MDEDRALSHLITSGIEGMIVQRRKKAREGKNRAIDLFSRAIHGPSFEAIQHRELHTPS
jgi:hypothetical protein